jgi:autotransporter passenger strand-loop-strand repeat protein
MASDYIVSSGVTSSGITLGSGDTMEVLSGGSAVNTTISNGAVVTVSSGGVTNLTTLSSGGVQDVSGSAASVIVEDGGSQVIEAGTPVVLISGFSHRSTDSSRPIESSTTTPATTAGTTRTTASTTTTFCGARAMPGRRASANARG